MMKTSTFLPNKNSLLFFLLVFSFINIKPQTGGDLDELLQQSEERVQAIIEKNKTLDSSKEKIYYVPVVIHVLNRPNIDQISTDREFYVNLINLVNTYYSGEHAKNSGKDDAKINAVNTKIQFILTATDPSGNPSNGINSVVLDNNNTPKLDLVEFDAIGIKRSKSNLIFSSFAWPIDRYFNVFVVHKTHDDLKDVAGFADRGPFIPDYAYAAYLRFDPLENMGDIFSHEAGHMLGLRHTFQGDDDDGDGIKTCPSNENPLKDGDKCPDTQPHNGDDSMYSGLLNRVAKNECVGEDFSPLVRFNIMSYSRDYYLFTNDQKNRMRAVLEMENYIGYNDEFKLFDSGIAQTESAFTRLVSEDRRCEASFYDYWFDIWAYNRNDKDYKNVFAPRYSIEKGDIMQADVTLNGSFVIQSIKNNQPPITRWISNNPTNVVLGGVSVAKLENRGTFFEPNCVMSVNFRNQPNTWIHTDGGCDSSSGIDKTVFTGLEKNALNVNEILINYDSVPSINETNRLLSLDGSKFVIKNGNTLKIYKTNRSPCLNFNLIPENLIQSYNLVD
jgi:hypothetical protein